MIRNKPIKLFQLRNNKNLAASVSVKAEPFINGTNAVYVENMYSEWLADATKVHSSWNSYFSQVELGVNPGSAYMAPPSIASGSVYQLQGQPQAQGQVSKQDITLEIKKNQALGNLIHLYQIRGHFSANLDPLGISKGPSSFVSMHMSERECKSIISQEAILDGRDEEVFEIPEDCYIGNGETALPLKEIKKRLESAYCGSIGVEYSHIVSDEERNWIKQKFESPHKGISKERQRLTLARLVRSTKFEEFLAKKWVSEKRFGLEGLEMIIPCMKTLIDTFALNKAEAFVIAMPHRGRLNVLANVVRKELDHLFCQFDPNLDLVDAGQSGDVKYHLGMQHSTINHATQKKIEVSLCANPSHLETVDPVAVGKCKKMQLDRNDPKGEKVVPLLLHGDAAFSGQGVVYETFHLSHLPGYDVGGAIHLVCNNQIGFTTDPRHSRASPYCTDVGRVVNAPIFHVNADDPDAVTYVSKVAAEFRQKFHTDVVIDLIGYRRHGHNEIDEPMFTQPLMYQVIKKHPTCLDIYSKKLIAEGVATAEEVQAVISEYDKICEDALAKAQDVTVLDNSHWLDSRWKGFFKKDAKLGVHPVTGVPREMLQTISDAISTPPKDITLHGGLKRVLKGRDALAKEDMADWSMGEAFGYGSLLMDGKEVRLSGQDVERGTFSHRHHVLHCQKSDKAVHLPMNNLSADQGRYSVLNSCLSEYGVMGFELGYALPDPHTHVIWEAQFGDFVNTAQCIIDTFLSAGEKKWKRQCGLTLQLPHGYEGMGPEHSSCRVERFLQMADDNPDEYPSDWQDADFSIRQLRDQNWIIANPTTPANCMHVHRRQLALPFRKPLILLTPKSLLRLPEARSKWSEMETGTSFRRIIPEEGVAAQNPENVKRVMFCSGKVYYDLIKERATRKFDDEVAICRVEQLAPFPYDEIIPEMEKYKHAQVYWVQEEHKNMGFYDYTAPRLRSASQHERRIHYAGRSPAASTAAGSKQLHKLEVKQFMDDAFRPGAKQRLDDSGT